MQERFVIRPDSGGHSVIDLWSGEPAMVAMTPQVRMSKADAEHLVALLNREPEPVEARPGLSAGTP